MPTWIGGHGSTLQLQGSQGWMVGHLAWRAVHVTQENHRTGMGKDVAQIAQLFFPIRLAQ